MKMKQSIIVGFIIDTSFRFVFIVSNELIHLLVLGYNLSEVTRDNIVSFDEDYIICSDIFGGDVPKIVDGKQRHVLLDDRELQEEVKSEIKTQPNLFDWLSRTLSSNMRWMSTFRRRAGVFIQAFTSVGISLITFTIDTAAEIGPPQLSARYTSRSNLSMERMVNAEMSSLFCF